MKMKPEHFAELEALFPAAERRHITKGIPIYQEERLTPKRWRWDAFYRIHRPDRQAWFDRNAIYSYLDDDHIDTALRKILPESW